MVGMSTSPHPDELLIVGEIVGSHGLRGQVKMYATTNRIDHFLRTVRTVFVGPKQTPYILRAAGEHKPGVLLLTLEGVTTRNDADDLRGAIVSIHEKDAAPLDADEYFHHELYNLAVVTQAGEPIGTVREVLETGANDVLVVTRSGQPDALIPMVRDVIVELDVAGGKIVINPIPGLLSD